MTFQEKLVEGLNSNSTPQRVFFFVCKVLIEGTVYILLGTISASIVYFLISLLPISVPAILDSVALLSVVFTSFIGKAGWCFLSENNY